LLENLLYNERRQKESIKLFEISDIYLKGANINQEKRLGLIISGRVDENYIDYSKKLDDIYLKNILNNSEENIEEISRENIKTKRKDRIFYTEVEVDRIPDELLLNEGLETKPINFSKYEPVSEYPSSKRDFSFSITRLEKYDEVIDAIKGFHDHNLKKFFIFDFFKNKKSNEVKIGVSLIFQSPLKTLSEDEIQESITKLLNPIIQIDGVSIPGLDI
jgi:phenylalanyl-tRNA synthetase beta subunit